MMVQNFNLCVLAALSTTVVVFVFNDEE